MIKFDDMVIEPLVGSYRLGIVKTDDFGKRFVQSIGYYGSLSACIKSMIDYKQRERLSSEENLSLEDALKRMKDIERNINNHCEKMARDLENVLKAK